MDSSVSPTHGEQEMSVWNGHYACTCYHPLFVLNQFGDLERCALRPGNVHSADGWKEVLDPVVARYRGKVSRIYFRADAGFANPEVYEFLEAERIKYAIRLPANRILRDRSGYLLNRPVGRPPNEVRRFYANFTYQAGSWTKPRRVIAKVEWHPGELYPRVGFIVTNLSRPAEIYFCLLSIGVRLSVGLRRLPGKAFLRPATNCNLRRMKQTRHINLIARDDEHQLRK
jgi:Transposase DDE domain group 1